MSLGNVHRSDRARCGSSPRKDRTSVVPKSSRSARAQLLLVRWDGSRSPRRHQLATRYRRLDRLAQVIAASCRCDQIQSRSRGVCDIRRSRIPGSTTVILRIGAEITYCGIDCARDTALAARVGLPPPPPTPPPHPHPGDLVPFTPRYPLIIAPRIARDPGVHLFDLALPRRVGEA